MRVSNKGAVAIRKHEGFRARAYNDPVGILTIGIGFTWRSTTFKEWWRKNKVGLFGSGSTMTKAEADECLIYLLNEEYGAAVNKVTKRNTPQHAFDAASSMVYNCGAGALRWRWAKEYAKGNYSKSADLLEHTAVTAKGRKLRGLVRRRKDEAAMMRAGIYPGRDRVVKEINVPAIPSIEVREIQTLLCHAVYTVRIDGLMGDETRLAIKAFQRARNLDVDGIAGDKTMDALRKAAAPEPPRDPVIRTVPKPTGKPVSKQSPAKGIIAALALAAAGIAAWASSEWTSFITWIGF